MSKKINIIISIAAFVLFINWSKNSSSPDYCHGIVQLLDGKEEKLVDIKIGRSKSSAQNSEIKAYRKPTVSQRPENFIEYTFDLKKIGRIEINQAEPIIKLENQEYVNIKIYNTSEEVAAEAIIPKQEELRGKLKETGWHVAYPMDKIKSVKILKCTELDDEVLNNSAQSKETAILNLQQSIKELDKISKKEANNDIVELKNKAASVLQKVQEDISQETKNS